LLRLARGQGGDVRLETRRAQRLGDAVGEGADVLVGDEVGQRPPAARAGEGADAVERGGADEDVVAARTQIDMNGGVRQGCISAECNRYRGRAVAVPLNCFSKLKFRS